MGNNVVPFRPRIEPLVRASGRAERLRKVEVREVWQLGFFAVHGFRLQACARGNRFFMVRS